MARTPCSRTAEDVDFGDGPESARKYVMTCSACGFEAWEHRHVGAQVVIGDFVPAEAADLGIAEAA